MASRKDHYIPATYIGRFSSDPATAGRDRVVFVGNRISHKTFTSRARTVGSERDFYLLSDHRDDPRLVDNLWQEYEGPLSQALDQLVEGRLDARTWARILVPFVTSLLVRGPDFATRFESRLRDLLGQDLPLTEDNTNLARIFELQRMLAPITCARWLVLTIAGEPDLITNDIGFAPFASVSAAERGYSLPLDRRHILMLVPCRRRAVATWDGGHWIPAIEYGGLSPGYQEHALQGLAHYSQRSIFGADEATIARLLPKDPSPPSLPEPGMLGFMQGIPNVVHEFLWHRLVAALEKHPDELGPKGFTLDFGAIKKGWAPPMYFPTDLPQFPVGLRRSGNHITITLFELPQYRNPDWVREKWPMPW